MPAASWILILTVVLASSAGTALLCLALSPASSSTPTLSPSLQTFSSTPIARTSRASGGPLASGSAHPQVAKILGALAQDTDSGSLPPRAAKVVGGSMQNPNTGAAKGHAAAIHDAYSHR